MSIFSKDSNSPRITLKDLLLLDLQTTTWTFYPIFVDATKRGRSLDFLISFPSNSKIISPGLIPDYELGLLLVTLATNAPLGSLKP